MKNEKSINELTTSKIIDVSTKEKAKKLHQELTDGFHKRVNEGLKKCNLFEVYDENCVKCDGIDCPYDMTEDELVNSAISICTCVKDNENAVNRLAKNNILLPKFKVNDALWFEYYNTLYYLRVRDVSYTFNTFIFEKNAWEYGFVYGFDLGDGSVCCIWQDKVFATKDALYAYLNTKFSTEELNALVKSHSFNFQEFKEGNVDEQE